MEPFDVVVIGGGPGVPFARRASRRSDDASFSSNADGIRAFYLGESLLPACIGVLDEIGVLRRGTSALSHQAAARDSFRARGARRRAP